MTTTICKNCGHDLEKTIGNTWGHSKIWVHGGKIVGCGQLGIFSSRPLQKGDTFRTTCLCNEPVPLFLEQVKK